jgi:hypothetical protein
VAQLAAKIVIVLLASSAPFLTASAFEEAQAIRNVPRISIDELKSLMEQ